MTFSGFEVYKNINFNRFLSNCNINFNSISNGWNIDYIHIVETTAKYVLKFVQPYFALLKYKIIY